MRSKKFSKLPVILIIVLILTTVSLWGITRPSHPSNKQNQIMKNTEYAETLSDIEYTTKNLNTGWMEITSNNYGIIFDVPKNLELTTNHSFDRSYPQEESVSISLNPLSSEKAKINLHMGLAFHRTPETDNLKISIESDLKNSVKQKDIESYSSINSVAIGNISGFVYSYSAGNGGGIVYFAPVNSKYYLQISFSRAFGGSGTDGGKITSGDRNVMQQIISSFKLNK